MTIIDMQQPRLSTLADDIGSFRRFNRIYTKFIGTLGEGMHGTEYSLAEARVLYEIATHHEPKAKDVVQSLGLDQGYLSRILSRFQKAGLVKRKVSKLDSRAAGLLLTQAGKAAFTTLDERSDEQARAVLDGLTPSDRAELIRCMRRIESVLIRENRKEPPYVLRPHRPGDMGWVVHREAMMYTQEYGWDETFEALVARIVTDFVNHYDPKRERCWIAEIGGEAVGHIFLVKHPDEPGTAKLRLLFVEPSARGRGLGHILVNECVQFARTCGYRKVTLWTQSILLPARRIYQSAGFVLVREEAHHSFGKDLTGQTWDLDLTETPCATSAT
jgi:DNA-binding MarR family transcriptional regulator/GNAT superfamily N-acetyltransferase